MWVLKESNCQGQCLVSNHDTEIFNLILSTYLYKTRFIIDEKFNAKGIQNYGI